MRYARRPHDLEGEQRGNDEEAEAALSRRVFMCYYRMTLPSLCTTPDSDSKQNEQGDALYRRWMVDIPKLFDLCAIYGPSNSRLVQELVKNMFTVQPRYRSDLASCLQTVVLNMTQVIQTVLASEEDFGDLMDHLLYLVDGFSSLCCFLTSYGDYSLMWVPKEGEDAAGGSPGSEASELLHFLVHSHVVSLPKVALVLDMDGTEVFEQFRQVGRKIESVIFDAVKHCLGGRKHGEEEGGGRTLVRAFRGMRTLEEEKNATSLLNSLEANHSLSEELLRAVKENRLSLSKGQATDLDKILGPILESKDLFVNCLYPEEKGGVKAEKPLADALLDRQVDTIRSILPEYGRGFIKRVLKHYEFNLDNCVSHMMEGSLPYELATLDSKLEEEQEAVSGGETTRDEQPAANRVVDSQGNDGGSEAGFTYYKKRAAPEEDSDFLDRDMVVRDKIMELSLYDDDYDDSIDFADKSMQHELEDLEGMNGDGSGNQNKPQEKTREFWVHDNKVYNYSKPGATKVMAPSAPVAIVMARQVEADEDKAARKKAREDRLIKEPRKQQQRSANSYKRKEKNKAKVGNHNRKQRALKKQGM
uniref:CUE domain-containing protein n=1 Tax=Chloropicon primus TaxID=1764295 RepID=A0A7S2WWT8_9CHLO